MGRAGACGVKLKAFGQEDLEQYSLKNFDLKAYQLAQSQPEPALPMAAPYEPYLPEPALAEPAHLPEPAALSLAPSPLPIAMSPPVLAPSDVQFGAHFTLQTVSYNPLAPSQPWKLPRWVIAMVGLFFGSAAILTIATCVVLLRDPKPAPVAEVAVPTAAVATTPVATTPVAAKTSAVAKTSAAPASPSVTRAAPATAAVRTRTVVSRHPSVVRRQLYGPRRVVARSMPSAAEAQDTEPAPKRPKDALDQLLSESSL
jgi:hypothetical protein